MTDINEKKRTFAERLDQLANQRVAIPVVKETSSESLADEMTSLIQQWEANLDHRLAEFRRTQETEEHFPGQMGAQRAGELFRSTRREAAVTSRELFAKPDASLVEWFQYTDTMMMTELEWGNHPLPAGFRGGYELIASDDAMQAAIAKACRLDKAPAGVRWKDYQLGVFHVPGRGTLINPSHYARLMGGQQPQDHRALAKAVSDMAMERWGWGFLLEYTSLGKRAGAAGLWPAMLADRAGLTFDDRHALALAQAIRRKWMLLKTGWQDWVWQYVMFKAHHPVGSLVDRPRPGRIFELFMRLQSLLPLYVSPFGVPVSVRQLVDLAKFIFLEQSEISPKVLNQIILGLQSLCLNHDDKAQELVDLPLSRMIGRLYFAWLENQVGILATPYAVLIAAHEPQIDFTRVSSSSQFLNYVEKEPRHNPDARLARLDARVKYNPRTMFTAAWERLKLDGPREYFLCQ